METTDPVVKGTEQALFLLTQKRSEAVFNDLLEYATDACLRNPPSYLLENEPSRYEATSTEDIIVQQLGARSLSTVLEIRDGLHAADRFEHFHISELLEEPKYFSDSANIRILENAERFGQALIKESFAILGQDAHKWVNKLKNATTEDDEVKVINWLNARIQTICDRSRSSTSDEDEAAHFYPPYRISPKLIGSYPKPDVQPSCLSASIMAVGFFERAGKSVLHAGVTSPANNSATELLRFILNKVEAPGAQLARLRQATDNWVSRPLAQHGAVYVKLSKNWAQFDPYGDATFILTDKEKAHLDAVQNNLSGWNNVLPNLEFSTSTTTDRDVALVTDDTALLALTLLEYAYPNTEEVVDTIAGKLEKIPRESYMSYLYDVTTRILLNSKYHNLIKESDEEGVEQLQSALQQADTPALQKNGMYDSTLRAAFEKVVQKFVEWDEGLESFISRCTSDPAYRHRRAEDLLHIPQFMAIAIAQERVRNDRGYSHLSVDLGNPAMRVGLATLSDFALYDNYPLPASFWITHWPGAVSLIENLDNPPASRSDATLTFNGLLSKLVHPFTSTHNYDKVNSFLSTYGRREENGNQG